MKDVKVDVNAQPLTLTIRFDGQAVNADAIGETAKQALESDENVKDFILIDVYKFKGRSFQTNTRVNS